MQCTIGFVITLRAPTDADLERFLAGQRDAPLSYAEVGASRGEPPAGYRVDHRRDVIGTRFDRAKQAIDRWEMHGGAGVRVVPAEPPHEGLTVALVVRAGIYVTSACRVVYRIDEPDRYGFAYGTCGDHPVSGEERFLIERVEDQVWFELMAFSRPNSRLARLGAPIAKRKQLALGAAYVDALRRAVA